MRRRNVLFVLAAALCGLPAVAAPADYPAKPLKIIVPFPAGSGTDTGARVLSQSAGVAKTGQPVIVDNRPGASGFIAAQAAAAAATDGYTLFVTTNTTHAANPAMFKKLPYRPGEGLSIRSAWWAAPDRCCSWRRTALTRTSARFSRSCAPGASTDALRRGQTPPAASPASCSRPPPAPICWRCRTRARRRRSPTLWAGRSIFMLCDIGQALPLVMSGEAARPGHLERRPRARCCATYSTLQESSA